MAECTRVPQKEIERRESYLRAYRRPRNLWDPYTWPYPYKTATVSVGVFSLVITAHNLIYKKPWYYGIFPRTLGVGVAAVVAFGLGKLRQHNFTTRDAIIDHYAEIHPEDFERANDYYGRPFSGVLLPWIPMRAQYSKFDD